MTIIVHRSTCKRTYSKYNFEQVLATGKFYFCVMGNNLGTFKLVKKHLVIHLIS